MAPAARPEPLHGLAGIAKNEPNELPAEVVAKGLFQVPAIDWDRVCACETYTNLGPVAFQEWFCRFDLDPGADQDPCLAWNNLAVVALVRGHVKASELQEGRYFRWGRVFAGPPPGHRLHSLIGQPQPASATPLVDRQTSLPVFPSLEDETLLEFSLNLVWSYCGDVDLSYPPPRISLREIVYFLDRSETVAGASGDTITVGLMASLGFYRWSTSPWAQTALPDERPSPSQTRSAPIVNIAEGLPRLNEAKRRLRGFLHQQRERVDLNVAAEDLVLLPTAYRSPNAEDDIFSMPEEDAPQAANPMPIRPALSTRRVSQPTAPPPPAAPPTEVRTSFQATTGDPQPGSTRYVFVNGSSQLTSHPRDETAISDAAGNGANVTRVEHPQNLTPSLPAQSASAIIAVYGEPLIASWQDRERFDALFEAHLQELKPKSLIQGFWVYDFTHAIWEGRLLRPAKSAALRRGRAKALEAHDPPPERFEFDALPREQRKHQALRAANGSRADNAAVMHRIAASGINLAILDEDSVYEALATLYRLGEMEAQSASRARHALKMLSDMRADEARSRKPRAIRPEEQL